MDILNADDSDELLHWLRLQPLLHHDEQLNYTLVHAGIYPEWSLKEAQDCAHELEAVLRGKNYLDFIFNMYGNLPDKWHSELKGMDRLRFICNCFTRMRFCEKDSRLNLTSNGAPGTTPKDALPWFDIPQRKTIDDKILFGHWSTLGRVNSKNVYALDTGCVWGGQLTALRIDSEPPVYISVNCPSEANPEDFIK